MNIFEGVQHLVLGAAAVLSAYFSTGNSITRPEINIQKETHANIVTRSGEYSYSGQTLKYTVNIPKDGGKVTGHFNGVCSGPIGGFYGGGLSKTVQGRASATCPILLSKKLTASYTAHLDLENGKVYIDWQGDIPYTSGSGSFTINFEPVN